MYVCACMCIPTHQSIPILEKRAFLSAEKPCSKKVHVLVDIQLLWGDTMTQATHECKCLTGDLLTVLEGLSMIIKVGSLVIGRQGRH